MVAVGFAGPIGSGKTTIAVQVHQILGGVYVSFGDYVRSEAARRQLGGEREVLQDLGEQLIAEKGWTEFCRSTLASCAWQPGVTAVIDGIRHVEVVRELRQLVWPQPLTLVFVDLNLEDRMNRIARTKLPDISTLERLEEHSTERQVAGVLAELADFTVDGGNPTARTVADIVAWLAAT